MTRDKWTRYIFSMLLLWVVPNVYASVVTQRLYLSGHGCDDMVNWKFFCTSGRNSGMWTSIGVPSCWELQGFGTYQYGMRFYGKAHPEGIADEKGIYQYDFTLPKEWDGQEISLVFEACMTDARVIINGRKAGNGLHQGGFYRFAYDVTDRVYFGTHRNRLEVTVSKESDNTQVNMAERRADYWNFGGIIRPVFVVAKPVRNIQRVAIDAGMDGKFVADCFLNHACEGAHVRVIIHDNNKKMIGQGEALVMGDLAHLNFKVYRPQLWTTESPSMYDAEFVLIDATGKVLHREHQKFGFRTIEYRASDGVYVNGRKVIFKGVNRHSFRPESGRTLSKAKCIEDVELIKSMNMNAVRLSHYPADPDFLDACDSLGLYVESELSGWHWAHETVVGRQLVKEMVTRDVNHPSIIFWSNGNEGGFNNELEPEFARWDVQKRIVLYPWANRNGFETKHYRSYGETQEYMRQKEIFMPTEFLHGLYDGGHGAGLQDYWTMMMANPRCAGGFLWDLADEGVVRTDKDNLIDCQGNFGADGIVGPHFEKEGSYYTIKEVWSPVEIQWPIPAADLHTNELNAENSSFDDVTVRLVNHYDFTNLNKCRFSYRYLLMPEIGKTDVKLLQAGTLVPPNIEPRQSGELLLKKVPAHTQTIELTITDPFGHNILTVSQPYQTTNVLNVHHPSDNNQVYYKESTEVSQVKTGDQTYVFSAKNGRLLSVMIGERTVSLSNGPRLVAAKRSDRSDDQFYNHDDQDAEKKKTEYTLYQDQGVFSGFQWEENKKQLTVRYLYGSLDSVIYTFMGSQGVSVCVAYHFGGVVDMLGVALDYPENQVKSKSWVGNGPYRVWQNRLQGPQYGFWANDYNDPIPGESWEYPEFKGYFSQVDWMQLITNEGKIQISDLYMSPSSFLTGNECAVKSPSDNGQNIPYIGVYTPRDGRDHILYTLPETDIAILRVIPAVRNKVNCTDLNGPSAQPKWLNGNGTIMFNIQIQ